MDESALPGERPADTCSASPAPRRMPSLRRRRESGSWVLAADTTVVVDGEILAKPADREDAFRMLKRLAGVVHEVLTGVVVRAGDRELAEVVRTRVHLLPSLRTRSPGTWNRVSRKAKPALTRFRRRAARFVDWIEGSWSNVVGLPVGDGRSDAQEARRVESERAVSAATPMSPKAIKIAVTCAVLVAALGGLMYTTLSEGTEYYIHVDEVMKDPAAWQDKRLQLHGFVADSAAATRFAGLQVPGAVQRQGHRPPATPASCPTRSRTNRKSC